MAGAGVSPHASCPAPPPPAQLFVALRPVARLPQRLAVLAFKGALPEAAGEALGPLARIAAALDGLRGSGQLRLALHTALRLGNALNAGRKAPQRGIRLSSLRCVWDGQEVPGHRRGAGTRGGARSQPYSRLATACCRTALNPASPVCTCLLPPGCGARRKLADTRSMDGSTTLMHYLAALLAESAPQVRARCRCRRLGW